MLGRQARYNLHACWPIRDFLLAYLYACMQYTKTWSCVSGCAIICARRRRLHLAALGV